MAASGPSDGDSFCLGSIVKCKTCHNDDIQGEVIAFDHETKFLILKQNSASGESETNDVAVIHIDYITNVDVVKVTDAQSSTLPPLSTFKVIERYKEEIALKMVLARARECGASNDGIQLYKYLRKAMPVQTVSWLQDNISVMDEVLVKPPYQLDNCTALDPSQPDGQCLNHVKKVVERFHKEERLKAQSHGST